jgi:integrase
LQHPKFNVTLIVTPANIDGNVAMGNTTSRLTNTLVKQSKVREKEYNLADGDGLYLRVRPSGTRSWLFNYSRPFNKQRTNLSLGKYPNLSLADARREAQSFKSLLAKHVDPKVYVIEQARKEGIAHLTTFEVVANKWLTLKRENISASYYKKITSRLQLHVYKKLGKTPLHKVNAVDTIEILEPLAKEGKLETIDNICGWLNEIMVYAVNTGLIFSNPLSGIRKAFNAPKTVNLPTLKPEELPDLMLVLENASVKPPTKYLIHWQLHTMVRPGEAAGTLWDEINIKKALWTIPAERMKKNRSHVVPLSTQMMDLLETLKPMSGYGKFVFPGHTNPNTPINSQTANMALKRMGFKGRLVSHGLRALASTTLNEQGFNPDVIEAALAHVDQNTIRATYNRAEYIEQRREMMQWWSDHVSSSQ